MNTSAAEPNDATPYRVPLACTRCGKLLEGSTESTMCLTCKIVTAPPPEVAARDRAVKRKLWPLLVAGVMIATIGAGVYAYRAHEAPPELEDKKFPGFTIGLPLGAMRESRANTYTAGSVRLELRDYQDKRIAVKWQYTDKTEVEQPSAEGGGIDLAPPGIPAVTTKMGFGAENIFLTVFVCDHRAISIVTGIDGDAATSVHSAIVKSVRCLPEPATPPPSLRALDLRLPATFKPQPTRPVAFPITTFVDEESGAMVSISVVPDVGIARNYNVEKQLKRQLSGVPDVQSEELEASGKAATSDVRFSAVQDGGVLFGYATATLCTELDAFAFTVILAGTEVDAAALYKIAQAATCRSSLN